MHLRPVLRRRHSRMLSEKAAQQGLVREAGQPHDILDVQRRIPQQGFYLKQRMLHDTLLGRLAGDVVHHHREILRRNAEFVGIKGDFTIRGVVLRHEVQKLIDELLPVSVSDAAPDRLFFELYEYVPIKHPEQQDDGLAADRARLRTGLARKRVYEVPEPLHLALHQREDIVPAHVEEKIERRTAHPAQDIHEERIRGFKKEHGKIFALLAQHREHVGYHYHEVVLRHPAPDGKDIQYGTASGTNPDETLGKIGGVTADG